MNLTRFRTASALSLLLIVFAASIFSLNIPKLSSVSSGQNNFLTGETAGKTYNFYTSSDWSYYGDYHESVTLYSSKIYIENLEKSTGTQNDIAEVHFGGDSVTVDKDETVSKNGIQVTVTDTKNTYIGYGGYSYEYNYYNALGWTAKVSIPRDSIKADIYDFNLEKTGPGRRKVSFNVSLTNNWHQLAVDKVQIQAFGKKQELSAGPYLNKGTSEYRVSGSFSEYNISKYKINKTVNKTIQVHIKNPRIPATEKSIGGADAISNPDFDLPDLKTERAWFTADIRFCGEAAEYVDGKCVIDEDLHLRGDTCFLPNNYTMVTETFSPGTYDRADIAPDASYFCSRHPVIVTNNGVQTDRKTSPYQKLVKRDGFTVPEGQTYTLFWVVNANEVEVTRVCEEGTLNKTTGDCVVRPGVVHKCSSGVWSPEEGACVVTPETKTICEKGRYNTELEVCVFNPPKQSDCKKGEYDVDTEQCVYTPDTKISCEQGQYHRDLDKCVYTPESEADCQKGEYDAETGDCLYTPATTVKCEKGEYLASENNCVYEPPVKTKCPLGSQLGEDGLCYSQASVKRVCPPDVEGTVEGGKCVTEAVTLVQRSPISSFRVFIFDLKKWVMSKISFM